MAILLSVTNRPWANFRPPSTTHRKIDATLISAKMHVINHVYTNLWCFQEQIIKKYMFIIVFFVFL